MKLHIEVQTTVIHENGLDLEAADVASNLQRGQGQGVKGREHARQVGHAAA